MGKFSRPLLFTPAAATIDASKLSEDARECLPAFGKVTTLRDLQQATGFQHIFGYGESIHPWHALVHEVAAQNPAIETIELHFEYEGGRVFQLRANKGKPGITELLASKHYDETCFEFFGYDGEVSRKEYLLNADSGIGEFDATVDVEGYPDIVNDIHFTFFEEMKH